MSENEGDSTTTSSTQKSPSPSGSVTTSTENGVTSYFYTMGEGETPQEAVKGQQSFVSSVASSPQQAEQVNKELQAQLDRGVAGETPSTVKKGWGGENVVGYADRRPIYEGSPYVLTREEDRDTTVPLGVVRRGVGEKVGEWAGMFVEYAPIPRGIRSTIKEPVSGIVSGSVSGAGLLVTGMSEIMSTSPPLPGSRRSESFSKAQSEELLGEIIGLQISGGIMGKLFPAPKGDIVGPYTLDTFIQPKVTVQRGPMSETFGYQKAQGATTIGQSQKITVFESVFGKGDVGVTPGLASYTGTYTPSGQGFRVSYKREISISKTPDIFKAETSVGFGGGGSSFSDSVPLVKGDPFGKVTSVSNLGLKGKVGADFSSFSPVEFGGTQTGSFVVSGKPVTISTQPKPTTGFEFQRVETGSMFEMPSTSTLSRVPAKVIVKEPGLGTTLSTSRYGEFIPSTEGIPVPTSKNFNIATPGSLKTGTRVDIGSGSSIIKIRNELTKTTEDFYVGTPGFVKEGSVIVGNKVRITSEIPTYTQTQAKLPTPQQKVFKVSAKGVEDVDVIGYKSSLKKLGTFADDTSMFAKDFSNAPKIAPPSPSASPNIPASGKGGAIQVYDVRLYDVPQVSQANLPLPGQVKITGPPSSGSMWNVPVAKQLSTPTNPDGFMPQIQISPPKPGTFVGGGTLITTKPTGQGLKPSPLERTILREPVGIFDEVVPKTKQGTTPKITGLQITDVQITFENPPFRDIVEKPRVPKTPELLPPRQAFKFPEGGFPVLPGGASGFGGRKGRRPSLKGKYLDVLSIESRLWGIGKKKRKRK